VWLGDLPLRSQPEIRLENPRDLARMFRWDRKAAQASGVDAMAVFGPAGTDTAPSMWAKKNSAESWTVLKDPHTAGSGIDIQAQTGNTNAL